MKDEAPPMELVVAKAGVAGVPERLDRDVARGRAAHGAQAGPERRLRRQVGPGRHEGQQSRRPEPVRCGQRTRQEVAKAAISPQPRHAGSRMRESKEATPAVGSRSRPLRRRWSPYRSPGPRGWSLSRLSRHGGGRRGCEAERHAISSRPPRILEMGTESERRTMGRPTDTERMMRASDGSEWSEAVPLPTSGGIFRTEESSAGFGSVRKSQCTMPVEFRWSLSGRAGTARGRPAEADAPSLTSSGVSPTNPASAPPGPAAGGAFSFRRPG